ncbi:outer membrane beta-barrel family protein [Mucilaginibacter psychrotolerans]|uniref:TonB-dependent receptor n=1 Tax=Mucilaginibacter psychrotolerans TaxID=1524096 RepID=A0A4Y8SAD8_9SPHI|nr:outer membrane beta-barrel family protein [Mucilaginibacter psychrotolerans]TFF35979.1 TonB-dependent receptor [Mucilaginibacter psychrotolerans]
MKLKLLFIIFFALMISPCFAQTTPTLFSLKGVTTDSATNKPLNYVTINLRNEAKQLVRTAATKEGKFSFDKIPAGKYIISIVSVAYFPKTLKVDLTDNAKPVLDLGNIALSEKVTQLKAVSITADKPIVKQEVDKLTYDLKADPDSKSSNVLDMMRKVPLLSVDADDNILLKGQAGFKILVNGKPSSMMERDPKNILKSMPASTIQSIEVITNPSSKYDAEGIGGIINIVTNKKVDNGYNGSINVSHVFPVGGPRAGGSFSSKQGKLELSAFFGGNVSNSPAVTNSIERLTTGSNPTNLRQNNSAEWDGKNGYAEVGLSYEIDSLNLVSGQFNVNGNNQDGTNLQNSILNGTGGVIQQYDLFNNNQDGGKGINVALNYQLGFKSSKQRLLTFSYQYFTFNNTQNADLMASNRVNYTTPDYRQHNEGESSEQTFQIDYVHPVNKLNIEAGVKAIIRDNNSDFQYLSFNSANGGFETDPARSNKFDNNQKVLGAYNSYTYTLSNWAFKAGARIEETIIDADFISTSSQLSKHFFNIVPSVSINRKFKNMSTLNLGFSQRIQRPGIYQLNPFVDRSNPNFESSGNPNLRPAVSNSLQLGYSVSKKASLNLMLGYNYFNDLIMPVVVFDPVTSITRSSFDNTGKARLFTLNANISYPITKKWSSSFNGRIAHGRVQGTVNGVLVKNQGFMYGASVSSGYNFEQGWRVSVNAFLNGPNLSIQGTSNPYASTSISVNKDIVKSKLSFAVSANNPFSKYRNNIKDSFGPDFTQTNINRTYFRGFTASLNYRFGKLKESMKKNKRGISNDDVQGASSGN